MFIKKIGIDLGTSNSLVFVPGKGIVLAEPSVVAVSIAENRILAVGNEAKEMIGRTPDTIRVFRPLKDGVISDYRVTEAMIRYFIEKTTGPFKIFKPELMIAVPAGITSTERRAVIEAGLSAGGKAVYVAKEPILAAIGAGIPINSCSGNMIVDIGGGTSEVAVISLGGIVNSASVRVAGDKIDEAISNYIRKKYNLAIGEQTAEEIKIKIGTALPLDKDESMEIRGRDLILGLPKNIKISSNEICEAISDVLSEIIQVIKQVLRDTPPELSADIMSKGMVLSGGGSLLRNIDELLTQTIGVPATLAEEPLFSVAKGAGVVLESLDVYKKSIMSKK
ncbi:MAG: rod shape-determining protein [Candidatus Nealsonbacteria bacterium CG23_combo_of_CG06-09_8_20_14_all_36_12]|uniref:Cell shape-determining protein MreB n=2 Tax=Candidatus Nealsoniibacteriota TaxID=1817911 RepID=A0A2H0TLK2_9BACT|nr:MAG: rod shape-determining protein [Candidatus Nealsonbacteria bacterium CG23_combo_of_CG06-09_8_20_14_all_36_12]PIR73019.1 MAG: rod shape-determining protein [Candidatus Nealsonbacteria bacterium CG10_big_fil_rev_8_21_14_0_10_36_23]